MKNIRIDIGVCRMRERGYFVLLTKLSDKRNDRSAGEYRDCQEEYVVLY